MRKLIRFEINDAYVQERFLRKSIPAKTSYLFCILPSNIWNGFFDQQLECFDRAFYKKSDLLTKKLNWLLNKKNRIRIKNSKLISYCWTETYPKHSSSHCMSLRTSDNRPKPIIKYSIDNFNLSPPATCQRVDVSVDDFTNMPPCDLFTPHDKCFSNFSSINIPQKVVSLVLTR